MIYIELTRKLFDQRRYLCYKEVNNISYICEIFLTIQIFVKSKT